MNILKEITEARRHAIRGTDRLGEAVHAVETKRKHAKHVAESLKSLQKASVKLIDLDDKVTLRPQDITELADKEGRVEFVFGIHWSDLIDLEGIAGLNNWIDDEVLQDCPSGMFDLSYRIAGADPENGTIYLRVNADASEIVQDYEDELEEQRQDEKHGLHPQHIDDAN